LHDSIQFGGYKNFNGLEAKGEFLRTPHSLDWAVTLAPIRPYRNNHLEVTSWGVIIFPSACTEMIYQDGVLIQ